MTPTELQDYLKVLREGGAAAADLTLPGGVVLRVTFSPEPLARPAIPSLEEGEGDLPPGWPDWRGM